MHKKVVNATGMLIKIFLRSLGTVARFVQETASEDFSTYDVASYLKRSLLLTVVS